MTNTDSQMIGRLDSVCVLAVDDEELIISLLTKVLEDCGYETLSASDGTQAVSLLQSTKIDVLLCDVVMPGMSGLDVLVKAREINPDIMMIIMMSGYADMAMAQQALDLGANDFLVKPFSLLSIPIAIERGLRRKEIESGIFARQRNEVLLQSIKALSAAMDAKEHLTYEHCERIAGMTLLIAKALRLSASDISTLELAAYMHDIGKIGVPESILLKPDSLSAEEWEEIRRHPTTGSHILSHIEGLSDLVEVIRHHHERVDGEGYPDGLAGDEIPLLSRILSISDAFDAMTSDRPYRSRLSEYEALRRLREAAGTQFDAELVDVFLRSLQEQLREAA